MEDPQVSLVRYYIILQCNIYQIVSLLIWEDHNIQGKDSIKVIAFDVHHYPVF